MKKTTNANIDGNICWIYIYSVLTRILFEVCFQGSFDDSLVDPADYKLLFCVLCFLCSDSVYEMFFGKYKFCENLLKRPVKLEKQLSVFFTSMIDPL